MDRLQEILTRLRTSVTSCEPMSARDYEQFKVDGLNAMEGNRNEEDGFNCDICKNKGYVFKVVQHDDGAYSHVCADCKCAETRRSIMRMKKSGLADSIKRCTFAKYEATEPWQVALKNAAMEYANTPGGWFYLGGQSGCGKTHLCTAICRALLLDGKQVYYMRWREDIARIKGFATDAEQRQSIIDQFKQAEVLYIDDLFKTGRNPDGSEPKPTAADINAAFEIINYRYNNPSMLTIISSELNEADLLNIDEAVGGRIFERSKSISIAKDRSRNYRIRKAVTL